ncbi:hypothetical protein [Mesorhizobium shangrilense]|uniref:Uncharacterized protein n=1 Tax=Mesorhizobium shangrilense TaxID=460060 RepID=A0ABV2D713_9HYPH
MSIQRNLAFSALFGALAMAAASNLAARELEYSQNPILTGAICIAGPEENLGAVTSLIESKGSRIVHDVDQDWRCDDGTQYYLSFPEGLESWADTVINDAKLGPTVHPIGTSGGSGIFRVALQPSDILADKPTPQNLAMIKNDLMCKMHDRLSKYFSAVNFAPCANYGEGFCWDITLLDHAKKSKGFNSKTLNNLISDKYWFRVTAEVWMGYFEHYSDNFMSDVGARVDATSIIVQSEFARSPVAAPPENDRYHDIGSFDASIDERNVDDTMRDRFAEILFSSPMKCEHAP